MTTQRESVILCEGYHDRAFWDGWLRFLGCKPPQDPSRPMTAKMVKDPWGIHVKGGQFGYRSQTGEFVRIIPCGGDDKISNALSSRLNERATKPLRHIVAVYDADSDARLAPTAGQGHVSAHNTVQNVLKALDPNMTVTKQGDYQLDNGNTLVSVIIWWTPDPQAPGLPWKQTLERLCCAALGAAFPGRAQAVEHWLQNRPLGLASGPKEYAWSNMAGWYAERGCEAFYSELWSESQVATELQSRLIQTDAWRVAKEVAT